MRRRPKRLFWFLAVVLLGFVLLTFSFARGPSFSWRGRLPARYRLRSWGETGFLFSAKVGQPAFRTWIYDSPYPLAETLRDLQNAFPHARIKVTPIGTALKLDGEDGPDLLVRQTQLRSIVVCARSEKVDPGPVVAALAHIFPASPPIVYSSLP